MKKNVQPRLMKVYQIQSNYQKHKQRLMSIQHFDTKKKPHISSIKPSEATINYKQSRLKADVFAYKTKADQIQHQNMLLLGKIQRQYNKTSVIKNRSMMGSRQSQRSLNSSRSSRIINQQNQRIYMKINSVKSNYSKIRKQQKNKSTGKISNKQEILNLLVNQFGVKPSVLFPAVPKKHSIQSRNSQRQNFEIGNEEKMLKFNFNNIEKIKKKHSLTVIHD